MQYKARKFLSLLFLAMGALLLIVSLYHLGWGNILQAMRRLDHKMILILIFPTTWHSIQSLAWFRIISMSGNKIPWKATFLARVAGVAVSSLAPMGILAGDPYRIYVLRSLPSKIVIASVIIDRTVQTLGIALLLAVSTIGAWFYLPLSAKGLALFSVVTFFLLFGIVGQMCWQSRAFLKPLLHLAQKIGIYQSQLESIASRLQSIDDGVSSFYQNKLYLLEVTAYHFLGRFLGVMEIYLIAQWIDFPITIFQAIFLATLDVLVNVVFVWVPANLGVMEGSFGILFYLIHLNPASGITIQFIRRLRQFFLEFFRPFSDKG